MSGRPLRIVLVMIEPPDPFGNAASRWFYVLMRELVARGHRLTAFAACSKLTEISRCRVLFPAPAYDLRLYPFPARSGISAKLATLRRPFSYMFSDVLQRDLDAELAAGFDILHLEQLWSGWVGLRHTDRAVVNVLSLYGIDLADATASGFSGRVNRWQMLWAERHLLSRYPRFITLSERLEAGIRKLAPTARVNVVPLGIDPANYPYIPDDRRPVAPVVSVIGSMGWYPSRSAAERLLTRLWPEIKRRVPAATCQVVGWDAKSALRPFAGTPDVMIEENVPDTRPYFERTAVLVYAPVRGSGMKVKVLEAFGYGVPVVTTSEGAEGIPALDGVHAGVCEDDAGLIDRTVHLLTDSAAQNRQRALARTLLEEHCGPGPTVDGVERVYAELMGERATERTRSAQLRGT